MRSKSRLFFRLVKKFSRSAAGHAIEAGETRSPVVCLATARYLVRRFVSPSLDRSRYDFVFDRLRAIRQDVCVGDAGHSTEAMAVLAACIRFHLYAGYK